MGPSFAGILGPIAYVTVLIRGVITGSSVGGSLIAATLALFAFAALGYVLGQIAESVVVDSVNHQLAAELQARATTAETKGAGKGTNPVSRSR